MDGLVDGDRWRVCQSSSHHVEHSGIISVIAMSVNHSRCIWDSRLTTIPCNLFPTVRGYALVTHRQSGLKLMLKSPPVPYVFFHLIFSSLPAAFQLLLFLFLLPVYLIIFDKSFGTDSRASWFRSTNLSVTDPSPSSVFFLLSFVLTTQLLIYGLPNDICVASNGTGWLMDSKGYTGSCRKPDLR